MVGRVDKEDSRGKPNETTQKGGEWLQPQHTTGGPSCTNGIHCNPQEPTGNGTVTVVAYGSSTRAVVVRGGHRTHRAQAEEAGLQGDLKEER